MDVKHFNVLVIGENHADIVKKYDSNIKVEPYIVYEFAKAGEYHKNTIDKYKKLLSQKNIDQDLKKVLSDDLNEYEVMDDNEFYLELIGNMEMDENTGNVYSTDNPIGKYSGCNIAKNFAVPFKLKDGTESYSAYKKDIDFSKMHLYNKAPYESAWDTVMAGKKPKTKNDKLIYENMKNRTHYFSNFKNKEEYVNFSTAFWTYGIVDENGWFDLDDSKMAQSDWVNNFYDKYVKNLPDNTLLTLYECVQY